MDGSGQVYMTIAELKEQEAQRRAGNHVKFIRCIHLTCAE